MTNWHIANKSWGLLSIEFVTTAHGLDTLGETLIAQQQGDVRPGHAINHHPQLGV